MALKVGIKLALARVCIDLAPSLLHAFYMTASVWIAAIGTSSGTGLGSAAATNVDSWIGDAGGLNIFVLWNMTAIPVLAIAICCLLIRVVAWARMFEIYVLLVVSPLPMAFLPLGDGNGGGLSPITGRFLKYFAAVCLQGVMIILCIKIFGWLMVDSGYINSFIDSTAVTDAGWGGLMDSIFAILLGAVVLVLAVFQSGKWAKQILDAA